MDQIPKIPCEAGLRLGVGFDEPQCLGNLDISVKVPTVGVLRSAGDNRDAGCLDLWGALLVPDSPEQERFCRSASQHGCRLPQSVMQRSVCRAGVISDAVTKSII